MEPTPTTDPQPDAGRFLTMPEAVSFFGKNERTLRIWLGAGRLHGHQVPERGKAAWRIWSVEGEAPDAGRETQDAGSELAACDLRPAPEGVVMAREQFAALLARHEAACHRIGVLEEQLRDRLPAIEAKCSEQLGTFGAELGTLRGEVGTLPAEVAKVAAEVGEGRQWIRQRLRGVAVALAVLAVMMAVVGGMVLTR